MKKLWDISPPVHAAAPVFPGDTAYTQTWAATIGPGCPVNVSAITLSPHVGAHADAPLHYDASGAAIGEVSLDAFLGPCRVIHAMGCGPLVKPEHIAHALSGLPERVLVRVYEHQPQDAFDNDLPAFAPETVEQLADLGVLLIGIDSASIDPAESTLKRLMEVLSVATTVPGAAPIRRAILSPTRPGMVNQPFLFQLWIRSVPHSRVTTSATRAGVARGITPSELPSR